MCKSFVANGLQLLYSLSMGICTAVELLKSKNLRITDKREIILSVILASQRPVNAKDLHELALEQGNIDLTTVYRVTSLLLKKGLIREIVGEAGVSFYEKACKHSPVHPHFHCAECGKVYCLEPLSFEEGLILGRVGKGFHINSVSLDIKGVCDQCDF